MDTPQPKWKSTNWLRFIQTHGDAWRDGYANGMSDTRDRLKAYVQHQPTCALKWGPNPLTWGINDPTPIHDMAHGSHEGPLPCSCGLVEAMGWK